MSPLVTAWAIVAAVIGTALVAYWVLCRALERSRPRIAPADPGPEELLRLKAGLAAVEWIVCDSADCRRLETPHRRDVAEFATCMWCGHVAMVPAPAAPKEGTDA